MIDDSTQYIARISYGKDSLKMLDVIHSRGLPLSRITTTDVWATDTISANLPPVNAFKERMDQWIWDKYRIVVEHLCALNPDGSKRTYEQMFYHIPKRRSQDVQVERAGTAPGSIYKRDIRDQGLPACHRCHILPAAQGESKDSLRPSLPGAESSRSTKCGPLFYRAGHDSPTRNKNRGVHRDRG